VWRIQDSNVDIERYFKGFGLKLTIFNCNDIVRSKPMR